jgi:hypothetical protein
MQGWLLEDLERILEQVLIVIRAAVECLSIFKIRRINITAQTHYSTLTVSVPKKQRRKSYELNDN